VELWLGRIQPNMSLSLGKATRTKLIMLVVWVQWIVT